MSTQEERDEWNMTHPDSAWVMVDGEKEKFNQCWDGIGTFDEFFTGDASGCTPKVWNHHWARKDATMSIKERAEAMTHEEKIAFAKKHLGEVVWVWDVCGLDSQQQTLTGYCDCQFLTNRKGTGWAYASIENPFPKRTRPMTDWEIINALKKEGCCLRDSKQLLGWWSPSWERSGCEITYDNGNTWHKLEVEE